LDRTVINLSGGEAKRIAVARALIAEPQVLLLDEPLTGLDIDLHGRLLEDLNKLLRTRGTTVLHVTHDNAEASAFADRVLDLRQLIS
ncbi:MAG: ATP-binding cassette domain-containing protein, partial [Ilumatobacteraceae bacterium]